MNDAIEKLRLEASREIGAARNPEELEAFRIKYLARKGLIGK